ncbi:PadR family transcriptional regulator [Novosphingobium piscinae]|uniref:PadR family transcriptional regulator n=2 Tax=Novosphingobium piscinae TaxID=1507448 RepID=A0A7X1G0P9_9SPHN|nr:PadR family transcriptional regulator [Novosphingobium piscinae]
MGHGRGRRFGPAARAALGQLGASRFGADFSGEAGFDGGGFGRGPFGGGGPFGRGRRGRMFGQGELRLLLLHLLAATPRHGYELIKAIGELTGGHYAPSPGVVYPTLSLLLDEGVIVEAPGENGGEGARKAFALSAAGRTEVAGRADEAAAIVARLEALAEQRGREASPPVMRAMTNLKMALRQRAATGLPAETAHQIADILDEAARRIERL